MSHFIHKDFALVRLDDGRFCYILKGGDNNIRPIRCRWSSGFIAESEKVARAIMLSDEIGLMVRGRRKASLAPVTDQAALDADQRQAVENVLAFHQYTLTAADVQGVIDRDRAFSARDATPDSWALNRATKLEKFMARSA